MFVYIVSDPQHNVFYIGVTDSIKNTVLEHNNSYNPRSNYSFERTNKLLYYETCATQKHAAQRVIELKNMSSRKLEQTIQRMNPEFVNLAVAMGLQAKPVTKPMYYPWLT